MAEIDLLLYPMGDHCDQPVCKTCNRDMPISKFVALRGGMEFSTFRCTSCQQAKHSSPNDRKH